MCVCRSTFIGPDYRLRGSMQGTLDTFGVVEILQILGRMRRSGTLHIECPQRLIDVHFAQGRIAETRDSTRVAADTVIGSQLLKRSLVNDQQLTAALAEQEARPRPIGTILVEHGAVAEDALREVLSRQIANTLVAAKLEASGLVRLRRRPRAAAGRLHHRRHALGAARHLGAGRRVLSGGRDARPAVHGARAQRRLQHAAAQPAAHGPRRVRRAAAGGRARARSRRSRRPAASRRSPW